MFNRNAGSIPALATKQLKLKIMFYKATNKKDFLIGWILGVIFMVATWILLTNI